MLDSIAKSLSEYWYVSGGVAFLISGIFYVVDKFSYNEKDFLNDCLLIKNQSLSKKALELRNFIDKIKNSIDNAQETEKDIYILFLSNLSRHHQHEANADHMRRKFKLCRNLLLGLIIGIFLSFFIGCIFLEARIYLSIFNIFMMLFALILIFLIRHLGSKLDNLRNHPDLFSST